MSPPNPRNWDLKVEQATKPEQEVIVVDSEKPELRKYQSIWLRLLAGADSLPPTNKPVRIKCPSSKMMRKVRKAVWKEKDLDKTNRHLWKLKTEFVLNADGKETGLMIFSITPGIREDEV